MIATLLAQIKNPALPGSLQSAASAGSAGAGLGKYIGILWQTALILGGLAVVAYMVMGGFTWIMAGGDKGKVEQAKERITQGLLGLAVLFSVAAISTFFGKALGIDLLAPDFSRISPGGGGGGAGSGSGSGSSEICSAGQTSPYLDSSGEYGCGAGNSVQMLCSGPTASIPYNHWQKDKCL